MADGELVDMASQFRGLPMADLIGGPLRAACHAQIALANATATFIKVVGFNPPTDAAGTADPTALGSIRTAKFSFVRSRLKDDGTGNEDETVVMDVPLLAIVKVPSLFIDTVDITFDMEVKSSASSKESEDKAGKFSADMEAGWGCFSSKVHVEGSVATHKENAVFRQLGEIPCRGPCLRQGHAGRSGAGARHHEQRHRPARRCAQAASVGVEQCLTTGSS